jgi:hypothetical protein
MANFSCGVTHLDEFLKTDLHKMQGRSLLKGYVLLSDDETPKLWGTTR